MELLAHAATLQLIAPSDRACMRARLCLGAAVDGRTLRAPSSAAWAAR